MGKRLDERERAGDAGGFAAGFAGAVVVVVVTPGFGDAEVARAGSDEGAGASTGAWDNG
jgi:hypothetical protein